MNELAVAARPLAVIEAELDMLDYDTWQKEVALAKNYIELGRRLEEVKAQLAHGEWGPWLEQRGYAQAKAVKLMKVFRAYGNAQQSLFGSETKSQAFDNWGFQKLVQLLAIKDDSEREQFVVEHNVEAMSTRELDKVLKERDAALKKAAAAGERVEELQEKLRGSDLEVVEANRTAREAQEALAKQRDKAQRLQDALSEANTSAQAAEEEHTRLLRELEELRSRPVDVAVEVDEEAVEAARKAAVAEMTEKADKAKADAKKAKSDRKAAEEALADVQRQLDELKAKEPQVRELTQDEIQTMTAEAVSKARAEDLERVKALEKQLASADGDVAAFRVHYEAWQDHYNKMSGYLTKITSQEPERADKLHMAVKAVIERMAAG
ncbi:MAG: DUF3102 domain-containing protein [Oscillospiraceae bacterium]|nr:DUF3102 domain-containing protein [Oscillospiraceae bacterium]